MSESQAVADQMNKEWAGATFEAGTFVKKKKMNKITLPEGAEDALGNHRYSQRRDTAGNLEGYVAVTYERAENEYPKMLYHPDWGSTQEPLPQDFVGLARTPAEYSNAYETFNKAMQEYRRKQRTKLVKNLKDEKALSAKGWLLKPPVHESSKQFQDSDEL